MTFRSFRVFCQAFIAPLLVICHAAAQTPSEPGPGRIDSGRLARIATAQQVMQAEGVKVEKKFLSGSSDISTRDLPNAALLMLRANRPGADVQRVLDRIFSAQIMNTSSPNYGWVPWSLQDKDVKDLNAIEFTMQPMGAILIRYVDKFPKGYVESLRPHLQAALVALAKHNVKVSYTNIYLMNTVDTLLLAQILHDDTAYARGVDQWNNWLQYTSQAGIHEFDSPTYYGTDLADLTYGYLYIDNPVIHRQMFQAQELFWSDICIHLLKGAQRMAGAHSRNYDMLHGRGSMTLNLYLEGLIPEPEKFPETYPEKVAVLENERTGAYHPSEQIKALADLPDRSVLAKYDLDPAFFRSTYLTQDFAIGFATGNYGPQDKMFAADFSGVDTSVSIMPDNSGTPYGLNKVRDPSGHSKPHHLPTYLTAAQDKGLVLFELDLAPKNVKDGVEFSTNLLLPAHPSELLLNGKTVTPSAGLMMKTEANSVVAMRFGQTCFAVRLAAPDPLLGAKPVFALRADEEGWNAGAIRLETLHGNRPGPYDQAHLHIVYLAEAAPCPAGGLVSASERLRAAKVSDLSSDKVFVAKAEVGSQTLELQENVERRLPSEIKVNKKTVDPPVYTMNGKALDPLNQR